MSEAIGIPASDNSRTGRVIFKNALFVTLGDTALKVLTFLFNIYVVRRLGDDRFGQYSIVLAFVGLFSIAVELGMTQYVMREIAKDNNKSGHFFWNLVVLRFLLAILGVVAITVAGSAFGYSEEIVFGIFLYTLTFVLASFQAPLGALLIAHERFDYEVLMSVAARLSFVVLGGLFLLNGLSFVFLIVASLISFPFQIAIGLRACRKHRIFPSTISIDPQIWPDLIRASLPFGMISLMLTIAFGIDTVMLSMFRPESVVGWYNVAYNLVFSMTFFSKGIKRSMVPSLSKSFVQDPAYVRQWYYRSIKLIGLISLPIAIGGVLVAFPLIRFLYTDEFLPSALALQILIWDVPLLMFTAFSGSMTTIVNEERAAARIYAINTIANVLLNLYAIPRFGLVGAALVTVVTDLIGALQFFFFLRRKLALPRIHSALLRVTAASLLMGAVVWLARGLHLFLLIAVGAASYFLVAVAVGVFEEWEKEFARSLVQKVVAAIRPRKLAREEGVIE